MKGIESQSQTKPGLLLCDRMIDCQIEFLITLSNYLSFLAKYEVDIPCISRCLFFILYSKPSNTNLLLHGLYLAFIWDFTSKMSVFIIFKRITCP